MRVLLVEDDSSISRSIQLMLRSESMVVDTADLHPAAGADTGQRPIGHQQRSAGAKADDLGQPQIAVATDQAAAVADGEELAQRLDLDQQPHDAVDAAVAELIGQPLQSAQEGGNDAGERFIGHGKARTGWTRYPGACSRQP